MLFRSIVAAIKRELIVARENGMISPGPNFPTETVINDEVKEVDPNAGLPR